MGIHEGGGCTGASAPGGGSGRGGGGREACSLVFQLPQRQAPAIWARESSPASLCPQA